MIGILVLAAAGVYLAVMVFAVVFGWVKGIKSGSYKRAIAYSLMGFLVVYLPVFWDHIPTVLAHKHYCAKDGGLKVFKDPDQWLAEHKNELEGLRVKAGGESVEQKLTNGWERSYLLNKRIAQDDSSEVIQVMGLVEIQRWGRRLVEIESDTVVAELIQYGSGKSLNAGGLKVWLDKNGCSKLSLNEFWIIHERLFLQEKAR